MTRANKNIEVFVNTTGDWRKACEMALATRSPAMDWLGLEATLRAYIRDTKNHDLDDLLNAFTKRGNELPCPKCGQMIHIDDSCK